MNYSKKKYKNYNLHLGTRLSLVKFYEKLIDDGKVKKDGGAYNRYKQLKYGYREKIS